MKKNLLSLMSLFLFLAMTCVSCSHQRQISADAGLSEESESSESARNDVSLQGSVSSEDEVAEVSDEAKSKASDLLEGGEEASLDLGASVAEKSEAPSDAASLALSEAPQDPMQAAEAMGQEAKVVESIALAPTEQVAEPVMEAPRVEPVIAVTEPVMEKPKEMPLEKPKAKRRTVAKVQAAKKAVVAKAVPMKEEKISAVAAMEADEFHAPIPQAEEKKPAPKFASAEIASFVERHVLIVSLAIAGFLFGLFIMMRRQQEKDDHRFPM